MDVGDGTTDIVHPEVRAHVNSLVSALGGLSADDDGQYQLGDDALEVLRDIKRWIRFYDEKTNRMDVARCLHEANLVEGDLLPILSLWPENATDSKFKSRVALACFEVLVPLTWPMDRDKERMTVNHHRHMPVLDLAQVGYKRAIINFDGARILHTAVRAALPAVALPIGDRTARDQGILKLVLFFLRNMAMVSPPPNVTYEGDETQISRSATIDAFSYQDIFLFILTIASNMGEEFRTEDTAVMEIIYHLVKRIDIDKLFMNEQQLHKAKASELLSLMDKESAMLKSYNRKGPTRHNRFGTMIWVKRDGNKMSSLSGQDALADASVRNQKMDSNKTYKPPRRARKEDKDDRDLGLPVKLNARANSQLRLFAESFLDSGFNPLFSHIRKTVDREASHVMQYHKRQFFYLVAWFLEAERTRRKSDKMARKTSAEDVNSFNLVAGVLNQEMFITLNRSLHESYEYKDWHELTAVMRCFTQILLTVQDMSECGNEDDEEIAENVLSRLFYEEATHDAIANIIRSYKDQGFDYLDAATELVHHFLRILEAYSKQNADMQVRSRKRTRRKKKAAEEAGGEVEVQNEENDGSDNDAEAVEKTSKERKFDFHRFCARFTPQGVVDTFVTFTKFYRDLSDVQLKRVHRYFYRVAFKQDMSVMLFRVDIIHLLYNMIKGPEALDKSSTMFKDWEELVKQILRKCFKKVEERPELIVELLFSKLQGTAFFLEYGYEKQTSAAKALAKPAAELDFKYAEELDRRIAIVVGALLDKNHADHVQWVKKVLADAESERRAWLAAEEERISGDDPFAEGEHGLPESSAATPFSVRPDGPERRTAVFKNPQLRLLMKLVGIRLLGPAVEETPESLWTIPSDVTVDHLKDALHFINQAEFSPPTFEEGVLAEHQLKRKTVPRRRAAFDDDEDGELDDDLAFPMGGPTARKAIDEPKRAKKIRRRRAKDSETEEPNDSELEEKARKRREREKEKARKIKSALYVKDGDDDFDSEEDEAFFARERAIAARAQKIAETVAVDVVVKPVAVTSKKRKSTVLLDDSDDASEKDDDDDDNDDDEGPSMRRHIRSSQETDNASNTENTPVDEVSDTDARKKRRVDAAGEAGSDTDASMDDAPSTNKTTTALVDNNDDDEDVIAPAPSRRPRVRGGFVMDSDDDE